MTALADLGPGIGVGRTADVFAFGAARAVKLFHRGYPADAIETEATTGRLVAEAGLPVPACDGLIEVDGRTGIIYERLEGQTLLEAVRRRPYRLIPLARLFAALQRQLHRTEITGLRPYGDMLATQIEAARGLSGDDRARLRAHLRRLSGARHGVCHGDFHPDNILLTARGPVVIDWMNAGAGDPAADVARTLLLLTMGVPAGSGRFERLLTALLRRSFRGGYRRACFAAGEVNQAQVAAWLPIVAAARLAEGIADERERLLPLITMAAAPGSS